jgi:hypothetical protein
LLSFALAKWPVQNDVLPRAGAGRTGRSNLETPGAVAYEIPSANPRFRSPERIVMEKRYLQSKWQAHLRLDT